MEKNLEKINELFIESSNVISKSKVLSKKINDSIKLIISSFEHENKMKKKFINKIENWFLECKYNPNYLYCRKRLMKEYGELYI